MIMNFSATSTTLVLIDIQEKLLRAVPALEPFMPRIEMMLEAAAAMNMDVIVTEQYPRGLGNTVSNLKERCQAQWPVIEKTSFSCWGEPEFRKTLRQSPKKTVVLMGIESHVCVFQTAIDLLDEGYAVVVLNDAVASRSEHDRATALELMRAKGIWVMSTEMLLFSCLGSAGHPDFKTVSKLIK